MKKFRRFLFGTLPVLAALAGLALLADGCRCDPSSFFEMGKLVALYCALPCLLAEWFVSTGRQLRNCGLRGGNARTAAGAAIFLLVAAGVGRFLYVAGPWHEGIVLSGTAPDGGAYFLSLAWNDWFDGYDLRLFHRQADGQWRSLWGGYNWDPEARGCEVLWDVRAPVIPNSPVIRLADGTERYFHDRKQTVHPASLSPDDLHALHLAEMRNNRSLLCLWKARKGGAE